MGAPKRRISATEPMSLSPDGMQAGDQISRAALGPQTCVFIGLPPAEVKIAVQQEFTERQGIVGHALGYGVKRRQRSE